LNKLHAGDIWHVRKYLFSRTARASKGTVKASNFGPNSNFELFSDKGLSSYRKLSYTS
jgi:hypothetical protein